IGPSSNRQVDRPSRVARRGTGDFVKPRGKTRTERAAGAEIVTIVLRTGTDRPTDAPTRTPALSNGSRSFLTHSSSTTAPMTSRGSGAASLRRSEKIVGDSETAGVSVSSD